jgi:hypothetical protein
MKKLFQSVVYVFLGLAEGNARGRCLHVENILGEENHCTVDKSLNELMIG